MNDRREKLREERGKSLNVFKENGLFFVIESKIFHKVGNLKKKI